MLRFTVNRMFLAVILMMMATVFAFLIVAAFPGNVAALIAELLGGFVSQDVVDKVAEEYRLNDPLVSRYGYWLADVLNGNLGRSFRTGEEVTTELAVLLVGGGLVNAFLSDLRSPEVRRRPRDGHRGGRSLGFLEVRYHGFLEASSIARYGGLRSSTSPFPKFFLAAMLMVVTCSAWCSTLSPPSGSAGRSPAILPCNRHRGRAG